MKMRLALMALAVGVVGCATEPPGPVEREAGSSSPLGPEVRKSYIVVYQNNTVNAAALNGSLMRAHLFQVRFGYTSVIQGFAAELTDDQVKALSRDPRVRFIEEDQPVTKSGTQSPVPSWGLDRIDQQTLPLNNSYSFGPNGAGVRFYGIDTGILYSHPDFGGRASAGFDAITPGGGAVDCDGHGTHTAATAGGSIYGVAKGVTIVGVRVLNCNGSGSSSGVIAGIDWVRNNAVRPAVANMSLGGGFSQALNTAVANAVAAGIVITVSAGNANTNACNASPASAPPAITVGATTSGDARASYSNFGTCLDIFAPGSSIRSAFIPSGAAVLSGTSMAAPHVAGAAALYLQQNPTAGPAAVVAALTGNALAAVTNPGTGSPNALLYTGFLTGGAPPPPPPPGPTNQAPVASFGFSCTNLSCAFDGSGSTDDNGIVSYSWTYGDGTTGSGVKPGHAYQAAGTYSVRLTVVDGGGLSSNATRSVTVAAAPSGNQAPVARAVVACVSGGICSFDATSSTDDKSVRRYEWRSRGGALISTRPVHERRLDLGPGYLVLTVIDYEGLSNTIQVPFNAIP